MFRLPHMGLTIVIPFSSFKAILASYNSVIVSYCDERDDVTVNAVVLEMPAFVVLLDVLYADERVRAVVEDILPGDTDEVL